MLGQKGGQVIGLNHDFYASAAIRPLLCCEGLTVGLTLGRLGWRLGEEGWRLGEEEVPPQKLKPAEERIGCPPAQ